MKLFTGLIAGLAVGLLFTTCLCTEQVQIRCLRSEYECGFGTETTDSHCECKEGHGELMRSNITKVCACSKNCSTEGEYCGYNSICARDLTCRCAKRYRLRNGLCEDINECQEDHPCGEHAYCTNTMGSYWCSCRQGYTTNGAVCSDIDECAEEGVCGPMSVCSNSDGSYKCFCPEGFVMNNTVCEDIDECTSENHSCGITVDCKNTNGSYACVCTDGYIGNGIVCIGIIVLAVICVTSFGVFLLVPVVFAAAVTKCRRKRASSFEVVFKGAGDFEMMIPSSYSSDPSHLNRETPSQLWTSACKLSFSVDDLYAFYDMTVDT